MEHYMIKTDKENVYKEVFTYEYRNEMNKGNVSLFNFLKHGKLIESVYCKNGYDEERYFVIDNIEEIEAIGTTIGVELYHILKRTKDRKTENHRYKVKQHTLKVNGRNVFDLKSIKNIWTYANGELMAVSSVPAEELSNGNLYEVKNVRKQGTHGEYEDTIIELYKNDDLKIA